MPLPKGNFYRKHSRLYYWPKLIYFLKTYNAQLLADNKCLY